MIPRIYIILAVIFLSLSAGITTLTIQNRNLKVKVSNQAINLKSLTQQTITWKDAYNLSHSSSIQQIQTVSQLKYQNDSIIKLANKYKIKLSTLSQAGSIDQTIVHDTTIVTVPSRDSTRTIDLSNKYISELLKIYPDSIHRELSINSQTSIFWTTHKETIDPPKSFFLFRWFQRKQIVTNVEVINSNPYITNKKQNFIIINK